MSSESQRVFVTHVDDSLTGRQGPCLYFWGQRNRSIYLQLENYLNSLAPFFNSCSPPQNESEFNGQVFCAMIDQKWLRVKITELSAMDLLGLVEVSCIDFGIVKSIPITYIREIPAMPGSNDMESAFNMKDIDPLADKFVLADAVATRGHWTEAALTYLKENMEGVSWEAVSLGLFSGHIGVRLYNSKKSALFATTIVERGHAVPTQTYQAALTTISTSNFADSHLPYFNTSPCETPSFPLKSFLPSVQPLHSTGRFPTPLLGDFPSTLTHTSGIFPSVLGQTLGNFPLPEVPTYSTSAIRESAPASRTVICNPLISNKNQRAYLASEIQRGTVYDVIVTYIQSGPRKFTIQQKETQFGLNQLRKKIDSLQLEPMLEFYRGSPCIALFSQDQQPHRGLITTIESDHCKVYYIDYGNFATLSKRLIFEIPDELVRIKLYACRVGLADIEELEQFDPQMVSDIFRDLALGKYFQCEVVGDEMLQKVTLHDTQGVDMKEVLLSLCRMQSANRIEASLQTAAEPAALKSRPKVSVAPAVRSSLTRAIFQVIEPPVNREEKLFITYVGTDGQFFGQLEERPLQELNWVVNELTEIYDKEPDPHLLYSDVRSHCGDFAVIKWLADCSYYRVRIQEELANDIIVKLVDYGNIIKVARADLLATVSSLKHFTRPAFGITCVCPGVTIREEEWIELLHDKSVHVRIDACVDDTYQVTFTDSLNNRDILSALAADNVGPNLTETTTRPSLSPEQFGNFSSERKWENGSSHGEKQPAHLNGGRRPPINSRDNEDPNRNKKAGGAPNGNWRRLNTNDSKVSSDARADSEEPHWGQLRTRNDRKEDSNQSKPRDRRAANRPPPKPAAPPAVMDTVSLTYPQQPDLKDIETLEIVYIQNPEDFYCQITEASAPLADFMFRLATSYENNSKPSIRNAKVGMACVAMYVEDGGWYRSQVTRIEGPIIEVLFVDYGNKQKSSGDQVKVIDKQFLDLPPQAYHCCLTGIEKKKWTEEDKMKLESATIAKPLRVDYLCRSKSGKHQVVLVDEGHVVNEIFGYPKSMDVPVPVAGYTQLPIPSASVDVNVSWYFHSAKFFLSPFNNEAFQPKMDQLEEFYSSLPKTALQEVDAQVGLPCVTRFSEDQRFYRAEIIAIREQTAEVVYVDYGNEEEAPLNELKRIVPCFAQFPRLAWSCSLSGVEPVAPRRPHFHRHEAACFLTGKPVTALLRAPKSNGTYPAEVVEPKIGDVAQHLTKVGVVQPTQDHRIVLPHQSLNFENGDIISREAFVSYTESTSAFWIQPKPEEVNDVMSRIELLSGDPAFIDQRLSDEHLTNGTPCLAIFPDDEQWYRAIVESIIEDNISVSYIDYGNSGAVARSQLRKMPAELAEVSAMAFKCCLHDVKDGVDRTKEFIDLVFDSQFTVEFVGLHNGGLAVRLFNRDGIELIKSLQSSNVTNPAGEQTGEMLHVTASGEVKEEPCRAVESLISVLPFTTLIERLGHKELRNPLTPPTDDEQEYFYPTVVLPTSSYNDLASYDSAEFILSSHTSSATNSRDTPIESLATDNEMYYEISANDDASMLTASLSLAESCTQVFSDGFQFSNPASTIFSEETLHSSVETVNLIKSSILTSEDDDETKDEFEECQPESAAVKSRTAGIMIPPFKTYITEEIISKGAVLSHFVSVDEFWIQPEPELVDEIMALVDAQTAKSNFPQHSMNVGESCIAFHSLTDRWYRAVINLVEGDDIYVNYVDYGNWAVVKPNEISLMPVELDIYPAMALKCSLAGIESAEDISPAQFLQTVDGIAVMVEFLKVKNDCVVVDLYDTNGESLRGRLGLTIDLRGIKSAPQVLDDSLLEEYLEMKCQSKLSRDMKSPATVEESSSDEPSSIIQPSQSSLMSLDSHLHDQTTEMSDRLEAFPSNQTNTEIVYPGDALAIPPTSENVEVNGKHKTITGLLPLNAPSFGLQYSFKVEELLLPCRSVHPRLEEKANENSCQVLSYIADDPQWRDQEISEDIPCERPPSQLQVVFEKEGPLSPSRSTPSQLEKEVPECFDNYQWKNKEAAEDENLVEEVLSSCGSCGSWPSRQENEKAYETSHQDFVVVPAGTELNTEFTECEMLHCQTTLSEKSPSQLLISFETEDPTSSEDVQSLLVEVGECPDENLPEGPSSQPTILPIEMGGILLPTVTSQSLSEEEFGESRCEELVDIDDIDIDDSQWINQETAEDKTFPISPQPQKFGENFDRVVNDSKCQDNETVEQVEILPMSPESLLPKPIHFETIELLLPYGGAQSQLGNGEEMEPSHLQNRDDMEEISLELIEKNDGLNENNEILVEQPDNEHEMCQPTFTTPEVLLAPLIGSGETTLVYPQQGKAFVEGEVMSSDAHVLCPCSAAEFWIQLTPAVIKEIDELIEDLSPDEEESNISWTIGNPCLAVDPSHEIIFRALVTSIQGAEVGVFCVDYGYSLIAEKSQLRRIANDLLAYPVQALKCSLAGFENSDAATAGIRFSKMITFDRTFSKIAVKYVKNEDDRVVVQIVDAEGYDLSQRLDEEVSSSTEPEENCCSLEFDGFPTEGLEEVAEPEAAQENIQRLYSESASEEIEASGVGETDEDELELVASRIGQLKLIDNEPFRAGDSTPSSKEIEFYISHFTTPRRFWIQLKSRIEDLEMLEQHIAELNIHQITDKKYSHCGLNLAYHPQLQLWRRAKVEMNIGVLQFVFVDYGDRCNFTQEGITLCPDSLKDVAVFAQECCVSEDDFVLPERFNAVTESSGSRILCQGTLGALINGVQEISQLSVQDVHQFDVDEDEDDDEDAPLVSRVPCFESSSEEIVVCDLSSNLVVIPEED